ncbi:laccase domain-containing protein [Alloscardovia omnicolens]|uniref:laccase domain-containing protein n=1 Tax=Alloscardovia omnicolens TaxID=419015 RepID=UPI003A601CB0
MTSENTQQSVIPAVIPIDIAHGYRVWYSTRLGGYSHAQYGYANMSSRQNDDPDAVLRNRQALYDVVGAPVRTIHQVHSGEVVLADEVDNDEELNELQADGLVSTRGDMLGVFGADCLPVLLVDPVHHVHAAAHCGRVGLMNDIVGQTVAAMEFKGPTALRFELRWDHAFAHNAMKWVLLLPWNLKSVFRELQQLHALAVLVLI